MSRLAFRSTRAVTAHSLSSPHAEGAIAAALQARITEWMSLDPAILPERSFVISVLGENFSVLRHRTAEGVVNQFLFVALSPTLMPLPPALSYGYFSLCASRLPDGTLFIAPLFFANRSDCEQIFAMGGWS